MAERRMFAKTIVSSDAFLDMPQSTQVLYFHLGMRADDDGFVNSPKSIMRTVGCKDDDLKLLMAKRFLLPFESGVVVIKHWRIHNYIASDRYHETKYLEEKATLSIDKNGAYTECIQDVRELDTQVRLGKGRLGKVSKDKNKYGECENVLLSNDELEKLKAKFGAYWPLVLSEFSTGKEAKGYKYKNDYAALLRWDFSRVLTRPAPARGKHCPRCGSRPMGSEDYCTVCANDSIAETDDVQHWVDDE